MLWRIARERDHRGPAVTAMRTKTRVANAHSISLRYAEVNSPAARRKAGLPDRRLGHV